MTLLRNVVYDELTIGQTARYSKSVEERDIRLFAAVSGDANPLHLDADYAANTAFGERIAHGMLTGALVSAALATKLPGPGTVYLEQSLRFRLPVKIGDTLTVELKVTDKKDRQHRVVLDCQVRNQHDKKVATGTAEVMAPTEKLEIEAAVLPEYQGL